MIKFYYDKNFNADSEVLYGLYETIEKIIPDRRIRFQLDKELDKFKRALGFFGNMAINTRDKKHSFFFGRHE